MLAARQDAALAATGKASFDLHMVPKPTLDGLPAGSVLIQTKAASICGSDLYGSGQICGCEWRKPIDYLVTKQHCVGGSGHEVIGSVVQAVEPCGLKVGDPVLAMVPSYISAVASVRAVFEERTGVAASVLPNQGAFAPFFVSHEVACVPLPRAPPRLPTFDPLHYCAAQPLGTLLHAVSKLGSVVGKSVAVVGQGQNGLLMTALLANAGARHVIALDRLPNRLDVARELGATHTLHVESSDADPVDPSEPTERMVTDVSRLTAGRMVDVAIDMVGHQGHTLDLCARLCKAHGTVLLFGLPPAEEHDTMRIRFSDFVRNLSFVCSHSPPMEAFALALELLQQGRVDVSPLFTHTLPFDPGFPDAYEMASSYSDGVIKTLITFE